MYSADKPIMTSDGDRIGRSSFSKQLAEAICEFPTEETFVVGLYGAWGSGKTSILNMTTEYLNDLLNKGCGQNILIVPFNPWNFTSCNQLIDQFFKTILLKLDCSDQTQKQKAVGDALKKYSSIFGLAEYIPVVGAFLKMLPQLINGMGDQLIENAEAKDNSILFQKKQVSDALGEFPGKIVVIIDDIDRLPNEQIRLIFQLVTSVADFPHMIYLLSFDKKVVTNALVETQQCDGNEYLEKVIQIPFEVPFVRKEILQEILRSEFLELNDNELDQTYDIEHWQNVFDNCISPYIKTFRDIKRYINTLKFKFAPLKGEVNFIDFAGITALQVFSTPVFDWIKLHKDDLLGVSSICLEKSIVDDSIDLAKYYRTALKDLQTNSLELDLIAIASLFPAFASNIEKVNERIMGENSLRNDLRIAYTGRFELYFTLSLDEVVISQVDLNRSINEMDVQELHSFLRYLKVERTLTHYFYDLHARRYTIPDSRIHTIISALFNLGFNVHQNSEENNEFQCLLHSHSIISELLLRISDKHERCIFYCSLIKNATPTIIWGSAQHVLQLEQAQGRLPHKNKTSKYEVFSNAKLKNIEAILISRFREISKETPILKWDYYSACSIIWSTFDSSSYEEYIRNLVIDPVNAIYYIAMQVMPNINPYEDKSEDYTIETRLGYLIDKKDSITRIQKSLEDYTFFTLSQNIQEKLADNVHIMV